MKRIKTGSSQMLTTVGPIHLSEIQRGDRAAFKLDIWASSPWNMQEHQEEAGYSAVRWLDFTNTESYVRDTQGSPDSEGDYWCFFRSSFARPAVSCWPIFMILFKTEVVKNLVSNIRNTTKLAFMSGHTWT